MREHPSPGHGAHEQQPLPVQDHGRQGDDFAGLSGGPGGGDEGHHARAQGGDQGQGAQRQVRRRQGARCGGGGAGAILGGERDQARAAGDAGGHGRGRAFLLGAVAADVRRQARRVNWDLWG